MAEQPTIDEPQITILLNYPVVRFYQLELQVSEEQAEEIENMNLEEKAQFIIDANEEHATGEMIISLTNMVHALDVSVATIKRV